MRRESSRVRLFFDSVLESSAGHKHPTELLSPDSNLEYQHDAVTSDDRLRAGPRSDTAARLWTIKRVPQ